MVREVYPVSGKCLKSEIMNSYILSSIPHIFIIILSIFVICKSYKKEKEAHNRIIKAVIEAPALAEMAMKEFPELKEEIMRITNKQN